MSKPFRWGILGPGKIAKAFARDLQHLPDHEIAAVGSRELVRAEEFSSQFGGKPFGSYEELVGADLDAIYVTTPHSHHAQHTILALEAGKPVLCEKPFAVNAEQGRAMVAAARENSVALMEAMWSRFLPTYQLVREVVGAGEIGEVIAIYADHGQALPANKYYRLHAPELAGGALLDLGIYPISLASMVLGDPALILATSRPTESGVDAQTSMVLAYESGAHALLTTTLEVRTPGTARIIGTSGRIELDSNFYTPTTMRIIADGVTREVANDYQGHGIREQASEFAFLVRHGGYESAIMSWEESISILEIMDEIREQIGLRYPFESGD